MSKTLTIVALFILSACAEAKRPPTPPPDQACRAACQRREELACEVSVKLSVDACTSQCEAVERLRPQVTHASCVATALDCAEIRNRCR